MDAKNVLHLPFGKTSSIFYIDEGAHRDLFKCKEIVKIILLSNLEVAVFFKTESLMSNHNICKFMITNFPSGRKSSNGA
jgi:hypothetical protein